jgi:hypothetical protein
MRLQHICAILQVQQERINKQIQSAGHHRYHGRNEKIKNISSLGIAINTADGWWSAANRIVIMVVTACRMCFGDWWWWLTCHPVCTSLSMQCVHCHIEVRDAHSTQRAQKQCGAIHRVMIACASSGDRATLVANWLRSCMRTINQSCQSTSHVNQPVMSIRFVVLELMWYWLYIRS